MLCFRFIGTQSIVNISLIEGTYPVAEGGALTFACNAISSSQPAQYRQDFVYYFDIHDMGYLHRRADGSVVENDRYTSIDDRTLRINPVSSTDQGWVHCHACEYSCSISNSYSANSVIQVSTLPTSQNSEISSIN